MINKQKFEIGDTVARLNNTKKQYIVINGPFEYSEQYSYYEIHEYNNGIGENLTIIETMLEKIDG